VNLAHKQEKDNLSNVIKESLKKKWVYKLSMPNWFKKAEQNASNIISSGLEKMTNYCCTFHPKTKAILCRTWRLAHDGMKKCKRPLEYYFWLNMEDDILTKIKECLNLFDIKAWNPEQLTSTNNVLINVQTFISVQICYCMFKLCFTPSHNIKPLIPTYRPRE
jgi:predicted CopG family antitoxin